jgi:Flp pilus assembly protein CpaB
MLQLKIGVVLALIAFPPMAALCSLNRLDYPSEADKRDLVVVLVAKRNLSLGTVIKEPTKYFIECKMPVDEAPKGCFHQIEALKYLKLKSPLSVGECVTKMHILTDADREERLKALVALVPPGHVMCTIRITPDFSGMVMPMDRVSVLLRPNDGEEASPLRVIVRNVLILCVDAGTIVRELDGRPSADFFLTVAVTPEQSKDLKDGAAQGKLYLRLFKGEIPDPAEN